MADTPRPPADLGPTGRKAWQGVVDRYVLDTAELVLLGEFCRTLDGLVAQHGADGSHRKRLELRGELRRLVAALKLDSADPAMAEATTDALGELREQRDAAMRQRRARHAANTRWGNQTARWDGEA